MAGDGQYLTRTEAREIANAAGEAAAERVLTRLGIDVKNPLEVQKDMAWLHDLRSASDTVHRKGLLAAIVFLVFGGLALLLVSAGIKISWGQ